MRDIRVYICEGHDTRTLGSDADRIATPISRHPDVAAAVGVAGGMSGSGH